MTSAQEYSIFCFAPVIAGSFDYLENIQNVLMTLNYPDITKAQVMATSAFTVAKSVMRSIFFLILFLAFIRLWVGSKPAQARSFESGQQGAWRGVMRPRKLSL
jgi:hypothetical protein